MLAGECNKIYTLSIINRSFNRYEPKIINSLLVAPPYPALLHAMSRDTAWEEQLKRSLNVVDVEKFKVNKYDRDYQIWKRESLNVELPSLNMFTQKLEYIHYNPVQAGLCTKPEDYYYSSARFYLDGIDAFEILTHFSGS